jgi:hypothetical protein
MLSSDAYAVSDAEISSAAFAAVRSLYTTRDTPTMQHIIISRDRNIQKSRKKAGSRVFGLSNSEPLLFRIIIHLYNISYATNGVKELDFKNIVNFHTKKTDIDVRRGVRTIRQKSKSHTFSSKVSLE